MQHEQQHDVPLLPPERMEPEHEAWHRMVKHLSAEGICWYGESGNACNNLGKFCDENHDERYLSIGFINKEMIDDIEVLGTLRSATDDRHNMSARYSVARSLHRIHVSSKEKENFLSAHAKQLVLDGLAHDEAHAVNGFVLPHKEPSISLLLEDYSEEIALIEQQEKPVNRSLSRRSLLKLFGIGGVMGGGWLYDQVKIPDEQAIFINSLFEHKKGGLSVLIDSVTPIIKKVRKELLKQEFKLDDRVNSDAEIIGLIMLGQMWNWPNNNFNNAEICKQHLNFPKHGMYSVDEMTRMVRDIFNPRFYELAFGIQLTSETTAEEYLEYALKYYTLYPDNVLSARNSKIIAYIADKLKTMDGSVEVDGNLMSWIKSWVRRKANSRETGD